jgi:hypothetical protein
MGNQNSTTAVPNAEVIVKETLLATFSAISQEWQAVEEIRTVSDSCERFTLRVKLDSRVQSRTIEALFSVIGPVHISTGEHVAPARVTAYWCNCELFRW